MNTHAVADSYTRVLRISMCSPPYQIFYMFPEDGSPCQSSRVRCRDGRHYSEAGHPSSATAHTEAAHSFPFLACAAAATAQQPRGVRACTSAPGRSFAAAMHCCPSGCRSSKLAPQPRRQGRGTPTAHTRTAAVTRHPVGPAEIHGHDCCSDSAGKAALVQHAGVLAGCCRL